MRKVSTRQVSTLFDYVSVDKHGSVARVKTTWVFIVCHLEDTIDTVYSKSKEGCTEEVQCVEIKDWIGVHDTVNHEGMGVPLFQTKTPGRVSSLCWMQLR